MSSQQISYSFCYGGNAAKLIQSLSTAGGIACGYIGAEEYFNNEYWTPAQITSLAIPTFFTLATLHRRFCNLSSKKGPPIPLPFTLGISGGVLVESVRVQVSACSVFLRCTTGPHGILRQCASVYDSCKTLVENIGLSWEPSTTSTQNTEFCDPTINQETAYTAGEMNELVKNICQRVLEVNPYEEWHKCQYVSNLKEETINQITRWQITLYNESHCNPASAYSGLRNADMIVFISIGALFLAATCWMHPLFINREIRAFTVNPVDREESLFLSKLPPREKPKIEYLMDNV